MTTPTFAISFVIKNDNHIMRSHLVHGVSILPGVVLLDMIYRIAKKHLGSTDFALRNISYLSPIATSDAIDQDVTVHFVASASGGHTVSVHARKAAGAASDDERATILECQLVPEAAPPMPPPFDIDAFVRSADKTWDMDETYAMVRKARIVHGEFMKALGTLYHQGQRALATLHLSAIAESFRDRFLAHPVFLDAATSLPFSFRLSAPMPDEPMEPYIPFSIQRFRIYQPLPARVHVYSAGREERGGVDGKPDLVSTDIRIFDDRGLLLAEFERVTGKRIRERRLIAKLVDDEAPAAAPRVEAPPPAARADKAPSAATPPGRVKSAIRAFLAERIHAQIDGAGALANDESFYELGLDSAHLLQLTKQLEDRCACRLYPTFLFEYKTIDEVADYLYENHRAAFEAPAETAVEVASTPAPAVSRAVRPVDVERLMLRPVWGAGAAPTSASPARRVVVIGAADEEALGLSIEPTLGAELRVASAEGADLASAYRGYAARLLACVQEILGEKPAHPVVIQALFADDPEGEVMAGLVALLRSAHLENPKIIGQAVLFDRSDAPARIAQRLADEATTGATGLVRHARGERAVQSWVAIDGDAATRRSVPWKDGGIYLVTGGAGGLGLKIAQEIASRAAGASVYLCGRSSLDAEAERALAALRATGTTVVYAQVDVAERRQVDDLIQTIVRGSGRLDGIVHAAGILRDSFVVRKTPRELADVLAAKVQGTTHLDEATKGMPLDVFILFSAMASFVGNAGQTDYAAANAFMDRYAAHRERLRARGERRGRTLSVNWPLWGEGGMRVGASAGPQASALGGMIPLATTAGFDALYAALGSGLPQVAVAEGERAAMMAFFAERLGPPAASIAHDEVARAVVSPPVEDVTPAPIAPTTPRASGALDIAVIGMSGAYPGAGDLDELWQNLAAGRDCISEVPADRWDWREYYTEDRQKPGSHYCKWGGFIDGVDQFDPRFFHISPREAEAIDPQERLFLEHAWRAMEDAGYRRQDLQRGPEDDLPGQVGVYAGVMFSEYPLFAAEASVRGNRVAFASGMASVANRVSYVLNLHGPSMTIDTMCSGAMTGLHLACQDLVTGRVDMAFAGAVNLTIHPNKYLMLSAAQFIAPEGRCASFGVGGEGYVPGEGVGVVVLKRLSDAERDGDHIYGVIKSTALNHGGKSNGFSVPSPKAQEMVIARALRDGGIDPRTISYIEAHGTGTKLGDPIEITALTKAFDTDEKQFCFVGSVKSNVGHCESAAGVVGLTKVLLQMQKGKIAPSLHSATLNPHIDFASTPFVVNQTLRDWTRPVIGGETLPRRAGISSFGAGGSNAHVIVEEHAAADARADERGPFVVVLSAKSQEQVRAYAQKLLRFLEKESSRDLSLRDLSYTLQIGREAMEARLGLVVASREELMDALAAVEGESRPACPHAIGMVASDKRRDPADSETTDAPIADEDPAALVARWVQGDRIEWLGLYAGQRPRRVSLPTYPFKRSRHWLPDKLVPKAIRAPERAAFQTSSPTKKISLGES
jgi:acyl transferase domain-containing protein